jgi:fumarate hydratase subunit alpha
LQAAIDEGVAAAYAEGYLRPSVLADPLRRTSNTGTNTPAIVHLERVPGDRLTLSLAAKGGGSENQSAVWMLSPSQGRQGIISAVVERVRQAGGRPCPPLVLGLGIGGNFETAPLLAKRALLRTLGEPAPDPELATLEAEILAQVNATGVGPMGMGGDTTALAVHALSAPCHLATLPVALNVQCHAARHGTVVI